MLTPYLLAGGLSTRMGRDKAFLEVNGQTLLEHALTRLRPLGTPCILSGDPANTTRQTRLAAYAETVPDRTPNAGPLGAIDAALHKCPTAWALILPVDQPDLPTHALQLLATDTVQTTSTAACFVQPTGPEPLPILLHKSLAPAIAQALHQGDRKLLPTVRRIAAVGFLHIPADDPGWFRNLNTPADL